MLITVLNGGLFDWRDVWKLSCGLPSYGRTYEPAAKYCVHSNGFSTLRAVFFYQLSYRVMALLFVLIFSENILSSE
jgi:hypothetical protein